MRHHVTTIAATLLTKRGKMVSCLDERDESATGKQEQEVTSMSSSRRLRAALASFSQLRDQRLELLPAFGEVAEHVEARAQRQSARGLIPTVIPYARQPLTSASCRICS
jgi:hypothetical protein